LYDESVEKQTRDWLPVMKEFEARMAKFEGVELKRVSPTLKDGEKEVIMYFHDECCFHANDEARQLW
jgi:Golgi nucleoside diphosphatase